MLRRFIRSMGLGKKVTTIDVTKMIYHGKLKTGFYDSVRLTLLLCRCIGLLPISGLKEGNGELTRYTLKSPYMLVYAPSVAVQMFVVGVYAYDNIISAFEIRRLSGLFFRIISCTSILLFIPFSKNWNRMLKKIESIEKSLPPLSDNKSVVLSCNILMSAVFCVASVEYFMYVLYTIEMTYDCFLQPGDSGLHMKSYFLNVFSWFYTYFPFNYASAVLINISKFQYAFMWTFIDVFIMVYGLYLVYRFRSFNRLMIRCQNQISQNETSRMPWPELQVHYTRLTRLVTIVDKNINSFVLLSFVTNLCFIGQQMFYIINKLYRNNFVNSSDCLVIHSSDWATALYQIVSLTLLVGRTTLVSAIAAHLNTLSRKPLDALHTVPAFAYNYDLQRFMDQVYYSNIGLTGFGFFHVTRGMILSVIATLVTYELVLLQF